MKIMDSKGRLFGKINLIDLIIILGLVLVGIILARFFLFEKNDKTEAETYLVTISPYTKTTWLFDAIQTGDIEKDQRNAVIARIIHKDPEKKEVTVQITAEKTDEDIIFKGRKIKVNSRIMIETENVLIEGTAMDIQADIGPEQFKLAEAKEKESKTVFVKVQLNNRDRWFLEAIAVGDTEMRELSGEKNSIAKIIAKNMENAMVLVELKGEVSTDSLLFKGTDIKVGSSIVIDTQAMLIAGVITSIQKETGLEIAKIKKNWTRQTLPVVIQVAVYDKNSWFINAVKVGDTEVKQVNGNTLIIAKILKKESSPSRIITVIDRKVQDVENPFKKDLLLTIEINCKNENGGLIFKGKKLKIGTEINIETKNVIISGEIIHVKSGAADIQK